MAKYLKKQITTKSGYEAECWDGVSLKADLMKGVASVSFRGYKDAQSRLDGVASAGSESIVILDIEELQYYPAVYAEIVTLAVSTPEINGKPNPFYGGTLADYPVPSGVIPPSGQ